MPASDAAGGGEGSGDGDGVSIGCGAACACTMHGESASRNVAAQAARARIECMVRSMDHDDPRGSSGGRWSRIAAALAVAAVLFWAATSNEVYERTSPSALSFHVLLRKVYSIAAFALVGFTADRALAPSVRGPLRAAVLTAAYSAAIEVVQARLGSHEGLAWNAVDVLCGAAGGWLGAVAARIRRSRRPA